MRQKQYLGLIPTILVFGCHKLGSCADLCVWLFFCFGLIELPHILSSLNLAQPNFFKIWFNR